MQFLFYYLQFYSNFFLCSRKQISIAAAVIISQPKIVLFHPEDSTIIPMVNVEIAVPRYAIEFKNPDTVAALPILTK